MSIPWKRHHPLFSQLHYLLSVPKVDHVHGPLSSPSSLELRLLREYITHLWNPRLPPPDTLMLLKWPFHEHSLYFLLGRDNSEDIERNRDGEGEERKRKSENQRGDWPCVQFKCALYKRRHTSCLQEVLLPWQSLRKLSKGNPVSWSWVVIFLPLI